MEKEIGIGKIIVPGIAEGEAIVYSQSFSFMGDFDPCTGKIVSPRDNIFGESIKNKIFAYPYGRGSSTAAAVILEAIRLQNNPRAIINVQVEPITIIGVLVAEELYNRTIPMITISKHVFSLLRTGDYLAIDSTGKLYRKGQS